MLLVALLVAMMMASGCASPQTLVDAVLLAKKTGTEGVARVYAMPSDQAWEIARAVFRWEKVDEVGEHRAENYMIASSGMKMVAFGTVIGVWIEPVELTTTRITVVSKYRGDCCPFSNLTADEFYKKFEKGVNIVRSGRTLPAVAP
jgi:hypothetical protein